VNTRTTRVIGSVLVLIAVLALASPVARAQEYRGNVFVKVVGPDGQAVVGATASLIGPSGSQNQITDTKGEARFIRIDPAAYRLTISFPEFQPVGYKVEVNAGANVQLEIKMNRTTTEQVTVTGTAPLLDRRKTGSSTALTATELTEVPQTRDPWSLVTTIPGLNVDRVNVGGSQAGQQSNFGGKGDIGNNNQWTMDGVSLTDDSAVGGSAQYFDFNAFAEINVATGGADFEMTTSGIHMNFIGKQGTNNVGGSMRMVRATSGFQKDNRSSEVKQQYADGVGVKTANQVDQIFEKSFDIGGPLVKDQLWWYLGFGRNDISLVVPTAGGAPKTDATQLTNWGFKVNGTHMGAKLNWKLFYTDGEKTKQGRTGGWDAYSSVVNTPQSLLWSQNGPTKIKSLDVGYFFTPNFQLSLQASKMDSMFNLIPPDPNAAVNSVYVDAAGTLSGSNYLIRTTRPVKEATLRGNAFMSTGSWDHELKFGYRYKNFQQQSLTQYSGTGVVGFVPYGDVYLYNPIVADFTYKYDTLWAGDTITHGPLTITAGVNYFRQRSTWNGANQSSVSLVDPATNEPFFTQDGVSYGGGTGPEWKDLMPRLGITYTVPVGQKRMLLRASYAKFVDQGGGGNLSVGYPPGSLNEGGFLWNDQGCEGQDGYAGDGIAEPCELDLEGGYTVIAAGSSTRFDKNLSAPKTNEFVFGAEYELLPDFTLGANVTYRHRYNTIWPYLANKTYYIPGVTTADYVQQGTAEATVDGVTYELPYYSIEYPEGVERVNLEANRHGYYEDYRGIEFLATKRLSNKWQMRAYITLNDWKKHVNKDGIQNPTLQVLDNPVDGGLVSGNGGTRSGNFADAFNGSEKWSMNANFVYQLPYSMTFGANFFARQGYISPIYYRQRGVFDSDDQSNTYYLQVGKGDAHRNPTVSQLDLRLGKSFKLNDTTIELSIEAFNALNSGTVLQRNRMYNSDTFNAVNEYMAPRLIRFGAVVNF
jgi:hypothetical protein